MGQKVNPVGVRLGFNKTWSAHWFTTKLYSTYLREDETIKTLVTKRYPNSGISQINIFRNRADITVTIHTSKPGLIIGRSGIGAQELRANIDKALFKHVNVKDRPALRINIVEVKSPELSAKIVAETIANQIERRISVKRAMKQAIERTIEKKALGIKVRISGRLGGAEIARSEVASTGSIPLQTIRSNVDYALAEAKTTYGIVGVKVWIYLGESDQLPVDAPSGKSSK